MSESTPVPFVNKGLVIKKDPATLGLGEFYQLENCTSIQEGALTARTGHQQLTQTSFASACVSLSKLNLGGADASNPRYLGSGTSIYRDIPPYSGNLAVYTGITAGQRWSAQQYNAGTSGTPALYVASQTAALRDNGSYTTLQKWGIDPPPIPVIASQAAPTVAYVASPSGSTYRFTSANSSGSPYYTKSLTAVNIINPSGANAGYAQITPTASSPVNGLDGIYVGMQVNLFDPVGYSGTVNTSSLAVTWVSGAKFVPQMAGGTITINGVNYTVATYNSPTVVFLTSSAGTQTDVAYNFPTADQLIVVSTDGTSLYGWITDPNPIGNAPYLQAFQTPIVGSGAGIISINSTGNTIDASFNGIAPTYNSNDVFHFGYYITNPANVSKIQVQIVPNYTGTPYASDYYEYDINPQALNYSSNTATSEQWTEMDIPKSSFTNVGNAGTGAYVWNNINQVYVVVTFTGAATVQVGQMYFVGGGGLNSAAAGTTQFDWMYTFRNPSTQAEGNPSPLMITANYPPPFNNGMAILTLTGTAQAATIANGIGEISGPGSISIYRRGGTFSDGFYRLVGYAANPGSGATVTFTDNASDASLNTATTLQFDNDPPVPSSLPVPLTASILAFQPAGGGTDYSTSSQANGGSSGAVTTNATVRLVLSGLPTSFVASTIASIITIGSTIQVGFGTTFEQCIVQAVNYGTNNHASNAWIEVYLQYNHNITSADPSETIEIDAIIRGKCDLVHQDFDCIFLAGDSNNPATLYQSKVGRPEAFPVVNLENNFAQQINVGSPSNPINGITSIGPGELVCLNLNNLFIVQIWAGQMQIPIKAPATRGLYSKWCWCLGDNRIWYLAYDGIYSWAGGESQKVSEPIDYLFKKQTINGIAPVDYTQALKFSFSYAENSLYVVYIDTNGVYHRLRFETLYNRWTLETIYQASTGAAYYNIDALFTEPDTGNLLVAISNAGAAANLWLCDFYSTTDGWTVSNPPLPNDPQNGTEIQFTAWKWSAISNPSADYQIQESLLELVNATDAVTAQLFFNYSTSPTNTITIPGGAVPVRGRLFSTVNSIESGTIQYSIGLKLTGATGSGQLTQFYTWQFRDFPWSDGGFGGEKTFGWLEIQANTNGQSVPFQLQIDGQVAFSFNVTGTFWARSSVITLPSNLTGFQYRVVPVSGYSGTLQVYSVNPKFEKLPVPLTHYDSLGQIFGYAGWKFIWQVWLDYSCAVPIVLSIYRDGNVLFDQITFPANVQRAVQRTYLPPVNSPAGGLGPQFNKSQMYRFVLDSSDGATPFFLYRDGSRVEVHNLDGDQRSGFEEKVIWTSMPLES